MLYYMGQQKNALSLPSSILPQQQEQQVVLSLQFLMLEKLRVRAGSHKNQLLFCCLLILSGIVNVCTCTQKDTQGFLICKQCAQYNSYDVTITFLLISSINQDSRIHPEGQQGKSNIKERDWWILLILFYLPLNITCFDKRKGKQTPSDNKSNRKISYVNSLVNQSSLKNCNALMDIPSSLLHHQS